MMKFAISAAALAVVASAQDYNTSAPFTLQLSSDNDTIDGQYLAAYHAGAAIEELALDGKDGTPTLSNTFALNTTTYSTDADEGILTWVLHGSGFNVSSGLLFDAPLTSNVVAPQFQPGPSTWTLGFDEDENLYIPSAAYDESDFVEGVYPTQVTPEPLYQVSIRVYRVPMLIACG